MPPIVWIILAVIVILWIRSKIKKSEGTAQSTAQTTRAPNTNAISFPAMPPDRPYNDYVLTFYRITELTVPRKYSEAEVLIIVHHIYNDLCSVTFHIDYDSSIPYGVSFADCYQVKDDIVRFDTRATGYTTPKQIRNEILLVMSSSVPNLQINVTEDRIYDKNDFTEHPMIVCKFSAIYKRG